MPRQSKENTDAKQSKTSSSEQKPVEDVVVNTPVVNTPVPQLDTPSEKKRGPRAKKSDPVVDTTPSPVVAVAVAVAETTTVPDSSVVGVEDSVRTPRVSPTRESVLAEHSEILNLLEAEVSRLRDGSDKTTGVKFLRSIIRSVKSTQANAARVMKQKVPSARKNNNSGFLKPVKISTDMAKFTGLDPNTLHSRVDVTKFLCKYIAEHNLQNPEDKRTINADPALSKLLGYDSKKSDKVLTYPHIQSLLKTHFTSQPKVVPAVKA